MRRMGPLPENITEKCEMFLILQSSVEYARIKHDFPLVRFAMHQSCNPLALASTVMRSTESGRQHGAGNTVQAYMGLRSS